MPEYKHWSLNPTLFNPSEPELVRACKIMEKEGFRLVSVVPYTQYLAVAVFEKPDEAVTIEEKLTAPKDIQVCYICSGEYIASIGHTCHEEWVDRDPYPPKERQTINTREHFVECFINDDPRFIDHTCPVDGTPIKEVLE